MHQESTNSRESDVITVGIKSNKHYPLFYGVFRDKNIAVA